MQSFISIAPLVICIVTVVMTGQSAAPLSESSAKSLRIANIVGLGILALSVIWTIIASIIGFVQISRIASVFNSEYFAVSITGTIVGLIIGLVITIVIDLALAYWHYYLLEKKLGGFKNSFKF